MSKFEQNIGTQQGELFAGEFAIAGCLDCANAVRSTLTAAFKGEKSREAIAEEMSHLIGTEITVAMLNTYTAESKRLHRFPAAWIPAFCTATGDSRLLQYLVQRTGYRMITEEEAKYMVLGRKLVEQQLATRELNAATEAILAERSR
jgi:hypothetical protein